MRTQLDVRSSWPSQGAGVEGADGTTSAAAEVFLQLHGEQVQKPDEAEDKKAVFSWIIIPTGFTGKQSRSLCQFVVIGIAEVQPAD